MVRAATVPGRRALLPSAVAVSVAVGDDVCGPDMPVY